MLEKLVTIKNETGLHARPASDFVGFTKTFTDKISLINNEKALNAKSILHVLSMSLKNGDSVMVRVEGDNEAETLDKVVKFIDELEG